MNESTSNVTLLAGFIIDLLDCYPNKENYFPELFNMAKDIDRNEPLKLVPISIYNDMCTWIEKNIGSANIRKAGEKIGNRAYEQIIKNEDLPKEPNPKDIMKELKRVANLMIQDPLNRGWEIINEGEKEITMRRTQTFNCQLQNGLLLSLVKKTGVVMPVIKHDKCTKNGNEFCEYNIKWM